MIRRAFLCGINRYSESPLKGCVPDVEDIWKLLTSKLGYAADDVRAIVDERATTQAIKDRMAWLRDGLKAGDEAFFWFSGHGSQIRDRGVRDELSDGLDEIIVPQDIDWATKILVDDDLAEWVHGFQLGVNVIVGLDACHSGSGTRGDMQPPGENPHYRRDRYLAPPLDIELRFREAPGRGHIPRRKIGRAAGSWFSKMVKNGVRGASDVPGMNHRLFTGCESTQTSADAYINGRYNGALSRNWVDAVAANPRGSARQIHADCVARLKAGGFAQNPQLEGPPDGMDKPLFVA